MQPERLQQRRDALAIANKRRLDGHHVKDDLLRGRIRFDDALRDPRAQAVRVVDLIDSLWGWGPSKVTRLANDLKLGPKTRVRDLSERRVIEIGHEVAARHDHTARLREQREQRELRKVAA